MCCVLCICRCALCVVCRVFLLVVGCCLLFDVYGSLVVGCRL